MFLFSAPNSPDDEAVVAFWVPTQLRYGMFRQRIPRCCAGETWPGAEMVVVIRWIWFTIWDQCQDFVVVFDHLFPDHWIRIPRSNWQQMPFIQMNLAHLKSTWPLPAGAHPPWRRLSCRRFARYTSSGPALSLPAHVQLLETPTIAAYLDLNCLPVIHGNFHISKKEGLNFFT